MSDKYLRFPLVLLLKTATPATFFCHAAQFAAVNAGRGFRNNKDESVFDAYLQLVLEGMTDKEAKKVETSLENTKYIRGTSLKRHSIEEAIVGASICGIRLGDTTGVEAARLHDFLIDECAGSPIISIKNEFFWNACYTARNEEGDYSKTPEKRISWREWRVLVAIYSLKPNSRGFSCAGWESISHRACGFHRKVEFHAYESLTLPWPDHCIPLSRRQTTHTLERLESLRFFIRHRISSGKVGGMMAYSIRHESREQLAKDCEEWQAFNRGETIKENRAQDYLLHAKAVSKRAQRIEKTLSEGASILETYKSNQHTPLIEPLESSLQVENQALNQPTIETCTSDVQLSVQGPAQPHEQHNEKYRSEKYHNKKYSNNPAGFTAPQQGHSEEGYTIEGRFVLSVDASRLMIQNPDIWKSFRRAKRITSPEGVESIEELAASPPL